MYKRSVKQLSLISFLLASLILAGCANMSPQDRRIGTGIGIGAATGALISGGHAGATAAGAVIGAGAGWLYDRNKKKRYYYDRHGNRVYERR
ncbi:hypothetical protein [Microbulbifer hainanensis]|uniref:hypothetical protein n=1 Tax=Microbulbifer hainanensis TaxID=2735675 RepID=UPI0018671C53|nr:hypothetical protein [Microbulbifer hainanensis]